jgi:hypothetical protein
MQKKTPRIARRRTLKRGWMRARSLGKEREGKEIETVKKRLHITVCARRG